MAQQTVIPQHVTALLTHLTSRPGVQSTFILSRKDGSIIQSTGLLAADLERRNSQNTASRQQAPSPLDETAPTSTSTPASPSVEQQQQQQQQQSEEQEQPEGQSQEGQEQQEGQEKGEGQQEEQQEQEQKQPYKPTHAEALAAHIFAFVSSASDLSLSLSHPPDDNDSKPSSNGLNLETLTNGITSPREEGDEGQEKEEDDEVKLLRLRTKKHEIVVVPDRKYLLCVVHDAAHMAGGRAR